MALTKLDPHFVFYKKTHQICNLNIPQCITYLLTCISRNHYSRVDNAEQSITYTRLIPSIRVRRHYHPLPPPRHTQPITLFICAYQQQLMTRTYRRYRWRLAGVRDVQGCYHRSTGGRY